METVTFIGLSAIGLLLINALNEHVKDKINEHNNKIREDNYLNSDEFKNYKINLNDTINRAKKFEIPIALARRVITDRSEEVFGFNVESYAFENCSDKVAVVTLQGSLKEFKFTEKKGIELINKTEKTLDYNLDNGSICKTVRRIPYTHDPIKNGPFGRVGLELTTGELKFTPIKGERNIIRVENDESIKLLNDANAISIFLKFDEAYSLLQKKKDEMDIVATKELQRNRDEYINSLIGKE